MIKHLITATSFALGGAGVVLVGYLSVNPRAFTHPVAELPPVAVGRAAVTPFADEVTSNVIVLPEVRITARGKTARKQNVLLTRVGPCSEWSDVGAMFIEPAGATGVRRVRSLCEPARRRAPSP